MTQTKVSGVTTSAGLIVVEPLQKVGSRYRVRASNEVAEVLPNRAFKLPLSNFATEERRFPKGIVVELASKNPLDMMPIGGKDGEYFSRFLNRIQAGYNDKKGRMSLIQRESDSDPKNSEMARRMDRSRKRRTRVRKTTWNSEIP